MKRATFSVVAALAACMLFSFTIMDAASWNVDAVHSRMGFSVQHMGINTFHGNFKEYKAVIKSAKADFDGAEVELTAGVNGINTDNEMRDKHLKSPDFFDAEKFPTMTFKSKSFRKVSGNNYKVTGDLTLHGVTKEVALNATLVGTTQHPRSKKDMVGFKVGGIVKRSEFGIGTSMPAAMLGEDVALEADLEFVKE